MPLDPVVDRLAELEALYRARRHHFGGYFVRRGVRHDLAGELVQETFVRAVRNLGSFKGDSALGTWVHRIAQAVVADHFRSLGRSPHDHAFSLDDLLPEDERLTVAPAGRATASPHGSLALHRALAEFARRHPRRAEVLHLVALNGWSHEELGAWLGRTPHAAAQYLSQCRLMLRDTVEAHVPEGEP